VLRKITLALRVTNMKNDIERPSKTFKENFNAFNLLNSLVNVRIVAIISVRHMIEHVSYHMLNLLKLYLVKEILQNSGRKRLINIIKRMKPGLTCPK